MTVEVIKALLIKLIESRQSEIQELKQLLQTLEQTPAEVIENSEHELLGKGSQVYARVLRRNGELIIIPIESYGVKVGDPAVKWLRGRFEKASEKHPDFKFEFVEKDGRLEKITVSGNLSEFERLKDATVWALEKAASR